MKPEIKKTLLHGAELLGSLVAAFVVDFLLKEVIPGLGNTQFVTLLTIALNILSKWLRENPNIPEIPDWVNKEN